MKIKLFIIVSLVAFLVADDSKTEKATTAPLQVEDSSPRALKLKRGVLLILTLGNQASLPLKLIVLKMAMVDF